MLKLRAVLLPAALAAFVLGSSGPALSSEACRSGSPVETARAMLAAAEAGDWETYVGCYYDELHKAPSAAEVDMLVSQFRDRWSSEVIEGLQSVVTIEPVMSDDGQRAEFWHDGRVFTLYQAASGDWKFRL